VTFNFVNRYVISLQKKADQFYQRLPLGLAGPVIFKIANQTYTDGMFVPVVIVGRIDPAVSAFGLLLPSLADLYHTISYATCVFAVVDDEMVSQAVPALLFVLPVKCRRVPEIAG